MAVLGIGTDMVQISEIERLCTVVFMARTFSEAERAYAQSRPRPAEAYAGMFAAKEALTKALCTLRPREWIDLRRIEVLHGEDGEPYVAMTQPLKGYLDLVGVNDVLVSITDEGDYAVAFAIAQRL